MLYKRLPLEEFMAIYHKVPLAVVDVIINSKDGILLTKRAIPPFKGMWHIPEICHLSKFETEKNRSYFQQWKEFQPQKK